MADLLGFLALGAGFGTVLAALWWLATRARRRSAGAAVMSAVDEVFHPAAHRYRHEIQIQEERLLPMQAPDGA